MIVEAFRKFIDSIAAFFSDMAVSIVDPMHPERERARNTLYAYWHDSADVRFMIAEIEMRDRVVSGFFMRHALTVAEFLKCGVTPCKAISALDDCILSWATSCTGWEDIVDRKCRELVMQ